MSENNLKNNADRIKFLNKKQEEITERQSNNLVLDFDQALKEENKEKIEINLLGKTYFLPKKMPFNFSTFFLRSCYGKNKKSGEWEVSMTDDKILPFIELMFGKRFIENLEKSRDNRISMMFVYEKIVPKILNEWGYHMDTSKSGHISEKKIQIRK
jgi:hypothetical protein